MMLAAQPAKPTSLMPMSIRSASAERLRRIVRPAARDGPAQRGDRGVVEAGRLLLPRGRRIGLSAPGRPRGRFGSDTAMGPMPIVAMEPSGQFGYAFV